MSDLIATTAALPATVDPTIADLQLAERLGYDRPTNIRNLIRRHAVSLEAMGSLLQREAMIATGKGAKRAVTEYHLNRAQTAFIIAKAGTKAADSMTVMMAEIFAMFSAGMIVPVSGVAEDEVAAAAERERARRSAMHREEKEARHEAHKFLNQGRTRRKPPAQAASNDRKRIGLL